jgi:hypothetical protein
MNDIDKEYWWLAVNGPSVAASPLNMTKPRVSPTPEQLIGFPTQAEQSTVQTYFLSAPIEYVNGYVAGELGRAVKAGRVAYYRPSNPEPPSHKTYWLSGE